jgi:hypothetical protein
MDAGMTRRTLLGSVAAATLLPRLAAGVTSPSPDTATPAMQVSMRLGEPLVGMHGWRRAVVLAGLVQGSLMQGKVQSGQLQWLVDPASGAVEIAIDMLLVRADGAMIQLRDRSAPAVAAPSAAWPGLPTAPALFDAAGMQLSPVGLAGRLDASALGRGLVWLRAFDGQQTA